ncbi:MAG: ATP-binding cassette domain-containing protein [Candidatus Caenarcaniphilales bacterium]|nr:ATP-binding cassette domain-containing protein [Candidatus Caenarcaniphilales bacterium]
MIQLKNLSVKLAGKEVLKDINLEIKSFLTTIILGQSGSGKSTLLRALVGLIQPDQGEIWQDGEKLDYASLSSYRHSLGYVIQDGGLFPHLSALENITLMAQYLGWDWSHIEKRLDFLSELFQVESTLLKQYPSELSGGQKQKVSLMRALMLEPIRLMMDEPFSALDQPTRRELRTNLKKIFTELKLTVVMVTHDVTEAKFLAEEIVLLHNGQITHQGKMEDLNLTEDDYFSEEFSHG